MKSALYVLPHNIEVIGEYEPRGANRYWRVRIREHSLFNAKVICGGMYIRRSRVVMTSVLGRTLLESEQVHHKDENVNNDSPSNLKLLSANEHNKHHKIGRKHSSLSKRKISESLKKSYENGEKQASVRFGEENTSAKLTVEQVIEIRASNLSSRNLGIIYGVSKTNILHIKANKIWRNL
jgi:hypothetical protein